MHSMSADHQSDRGKRLEKARIHRGFSTAKDAALGTSAWVVVGLGGRSKCSREQKKDSQSDTHGNLSTRELSSDFPKFSVSSRGDTKGNPECDVQFAHFC